MWTVFQAKIQTIKTDDSNPEKDKENFLNLISDLHSKIESIQHGRGGRCWKDKEGNLFIGDEKDTTIKFSTQGTINVSHPAA